VTARSVVGWGPGAFLVLGLDVGELAAVGEDFPLACGGVEVSRRLPLVVDADGEFLLPRADGLFDIVDDFDVVALLDLLVGFRVDLQGQQTEVEQVRLVDCPVPSPRRRYHQLRTRRQSGKHDHHGVRRVL